MKVFSARIQAEGQTCFIELPFDPGPVFGTSCAAVKVTLNGHRFRATIEGRHGDSRVSLNPGNRKDARVRAGETVSVQIELDTAGPEVYPPLDLVTALKAAPSAWQRWTEMNPVRQREQVDELAKAKRPETRAKRLAEAVVQIARRPGRKAT